MKNRLPKSKNSFLSSIKTSTFDWLYEELNLENILGTVKKFSMENDVDNLLEEFTNIKINNASTSNQRKKSQIKKKKKKRK